MAKVFRFQEKKGLELDINEIKFFVEVDDPLFFAKLESFSKTLLEINSRYKDTKNIEEVVKNAESIMNACSDGIDSLLGEGSTEKIFGDRPISFLDITDLSHFVFTEISNYVNKDLMSKYSPQRINK